MTLTTPYSATFQVGDGVTKEFPYLFEEVSESFVSVVVYDSITGTTTTPIYTVNTAQKKVIFSAETPAPTADQTVCIYRNTPNTQDVEFRTLQGYDAKSMENILSKIVAMIQEIKSNYFSTEILQGDPWQLDLLTSDADGATVKVDYAGKKLTKGLYFRVTGGQLEVSEDGTDYFPVTPSELPDQGGNNGKFLTTDGTDASWAALATVATSGSYTDLTNTPSIPAAQVNSDWNAVSGVAQILNKPTLATVATSGSYTDLSNKPTIPTVNNATLTITQGGVSKGTFTANASTDVTIEVDAGGSSLPSQTGNSGKFLTTDGTDASWATVDALPSQTSQSGKFLTTDGTDASWKGLELTDITGSAAVTTVATNIADVNTVAADTTNIDTVATNIADVNTCATNITAIQNASTNAENAEKWAEGTDAQVSPLGGTHSSKGWATQAQNYAISADDSRMTAQNSATAAQGYATSAATSAQQALQNSQRLMVSINKANCWSRTYTGLDTEKRYQFVTANNDLATPIISDTVYTTQEDISDVPCYTDSVSYPNLMIGNTLYTKELARDTTVTFNNAVMLGDYEHLDSNGQVYQIGLYFDGTFNSGWTTVFYPNSHSSTMYGFGIRDGKLYSVTNTNASTGPFYAYYTATLLDDTGTWTYVRGFNTSGQSNFALGIKDGKLYKIENLTVSLLDDNLAWTPESLMYNSDSYSSAVALINSEIYGIDDSGVYPTNFNLSIKKMNGIRRIITTDGKLYNLGGNASTLYITQVGSDTDWTDISWGSLNRYLAIKGGDLVMISGNTVTPVTTGKSYVGVAGQFGYAAYSHTNTFVVWEQTPIVHTEKAYTTPTSTVGDNLYGTTSLGNPRAIVSIDASTVSDSTNTYTRDSTGDTYFVGRPDTFVSTNLTTGDVVDALSN